MLAYTKDNKVIHINNALPKTDYFCANCGGRLRVRNGKIRAKHFVHINDDCKDQGESLIHECWKKYFSKLKNFEGYNIIASRQERPLLNGAYIPDVILKTDKNNYIIIEVDYKNSKDKSYLEKFKLLPKTFIKVFEVKVDFGKILDTKILFDREREKRIEERKKELNKEVEEIRQYILDKYYNNGGLVFDQDHHMPYFQFILHKDLKPKYGYSSYKSKWQYRYIIKSSLKYKKFKVYLMKSLHFENQYISEKSSSFYINIYDYTNIYTHLKWFGTLGSIYSKDEKLVGNIEVILDEKS